MFSQDEAVKAAGNTVSFVFRTKMFGQDTAQGRLWENTDAPVLKLNFIFNTWNVLSSLFEYFLLKPGNKWVGENIFIIVEQNLCFPFSSSSFLFLLYILRHLCVLPNFPLSFRKLALQSQLITPSLLEKWHTYPRDCKLAEIDWRVLEISKLAYLVITFYSENSNKKKRKMCFYTSPG